MKKKTLFITGASGFLGSRILDRLIPDDYSKITLLSRTTIELPKQLSTADNITIVLATIHDVDLYGSMLDSNTIVMHLAAMTGKANPEDYYHVNTEGTAALLKASTQANVNNFLFISSIAVCFNKREGYHYAESKQQAEQKVRESGLTYCIVRPTIILGKGAPIWESFSSLSRPSVILLPGSGKIRIQPIDLDDVVALLLGIISTTHFMNETLELGGPESLTMDDFVQRIHFAYKKHQAHIIHLPLGIILGILRMIETQLPALLPVSSGQFASFCNDGTAKDNNLHDSLGIKMKTIDDMLERLTGQS